VEVVLVVLVAGRMEYKDQMEVTLFSLLLLPQVVEVVVVVNRVQLQD
jgi:hypothetical protein